MSKKPVIGITLDLAEDSEKYSYAPLPWYAIRCDYSASVEKAGGIPIMLPYNDDIDSILELIDGLIIPGGDEDVNPEFYGQEITSDKVKTNDKRAEFELELTKKAVDMNMPILGICNGLQIINTIFGGTLFQHLPDVIDNDINHEQPAPKNVPSHPVIIEQNTILSKLSKDSRVMVNSTHHQAIDKVGEGLIVSAKAPDGVIEAIESGNHKFLIGTEWHCEYLNSELDRNLFKKLIEESR